jgi:hypothetical protein
MHIWVHKWRNACRILFRCGGTSFYGGTADRVNKSKNQICTKVDDKTGVDLLRTVSEATMSLDLPLVSLVMYLQEGEVSPRG